MFHTQSSLRQSGSNSTNSTSSRLPTLWLMSACLAILLSHDSVHGGTAISPAARETTEGDLKSESWPVTSRGMTIYGSSVFDAVEGAVRITHFNLRPDGSVPVGAQFGFDNLKLLFSITPVQPLDMSSTFETNVSNATTEPVVVFDQEWVREVVSEPQAAGAPRPFDFHIELTSPFEFDPSEGNLLVDWVFGSPIPGQSAFDRDGATYSDHKAIWANGANPPSADGIFSVPTQFVFEPVPEPKFGLEYLILAAGVTGLRRHRRSFRPE